MWFGNIGRRAGTYSGRVLGVPDFLITSVMPAVTVGRPKRSEAMWDAIKNHIIRERQKKKQGMSLNRVETFLLTN